MIQKHNADFQPVIGLDAEGTRDLVVPNRTGLLLPPQPSSWPTLSRAADSSAFRSAANDYASLLAQVSTSHTERREMSARAASEGIVGYTWWDAMERCVDGYREGMRIATASRAARGLSLPAKKVGRVGRALSVGLAHRGKWGGDLVDVKAGLGGRSIKKARGVDTAESLWHLSTWPAHGWSRMALIGQRI